MSIEAGVTVFMGAGTSIFVQAGSLQVTGTADQPVFILSDRVRLGLLPVPGDWERWVIGPGGSETSISYARIEHGKGLAVMGSSPSVNHVDLRNHLGPAMSLDLAASPQGVGNKASGNLLNGIEVPSGEVTGQVRWGIRGIPYVVSGGVLSIGIRPRLQAALPSTIQGGQAITLSLSGVRLAGLSDPRFDTPDLVATVRPGGSDTSASLSVTASPTARGGPASLTVQTDAGIASLPAALTVTQTTPEILGLDPSSVVINQGPVDLRVTGRQFNSTAAVRLDGQDLPTSFVSSSELRASVPNISITGTPRVQVRIQDPAQPTEFVFSNEVGLPVVASGPLALSPSRLSVLLGGTKALNLLLPYPAPDGGMTVALASSTPAVATVPATITIPTGSISASFQVTALQEGAATITASRAGFLAATATVSVTTGVTYTITPQPLVALPNGAARSFTVEASDPVAVPVEFVASTANPAIGEAGGQPIVLQPGATSAIGSLTGVAPGTTTLRVQRVGGGAPLEVQVTVGDGLTGGALAYSTPLGLVRNASSEPPSGATVGPVTARPLGLSRGADGSPPSGAEVGPIYSKPLGLSRAASDDLAPGSAMGPVISRPLGLSRASDDFLTPGAAFGPIVSRPLGLIRNAEPGATPGTSFGPVNSQPLGLIKP